jgi:predicted nucleotidyltransferase
MDAMSPHLVIDRSAVTAFCQRHHIARLALFGSALRDDFGADSDVDLLVEFPNARTLERTLAEFQTYYNAARGHASLEGHTPLTFASGQTAVLADLNHMRWVSHCRDLVHLPVAA